MLAALQDTRPVELFNLLAQIEESLSRRPPNLPTVVRHALRESFADGCWLAPKHCEGSSASYQRHVLHSDPAGRFTIVSIVWQPGQVTPVHAHHVWCALAVVDGQLSEEVFGYNAETDLVHPKFTFEHKRLDGSSALAGLHHIHRIRNNSDRRAISVHVYGVDGTQVTTGVNRVLQPA
ncbi:3-mercaptopropionate dioxygenase [Pandoraea terrae]|uniref:3-mercaptopropionate dioxygenase n=1 Tax=Pandoraea terrae TaxID=1537710 RepID=A0A5E4VE16_9BURK|nr:cysteine dioxygenase family protein [Pandoraea terrae]VVE09649.1 3-mercaptopropionate dioxygenase [Pandoraea terrae]